MRPLLSEFGPKRKDIYFGSKISILYWTSDSVHSTPICIDTGSIKSQGTFILPNHFKSPMDFLGLGDVQNLGKMNRAGSSPYNAIRQDQDKGVGFPNSVGGPFLQFPRYPLSDFPKPKRYPPKHQSLAALAKLMSIIRWVPCENSKGQG